MKNRKSLIPVILTVFPLFALIATLHLIQRNQETRRQAAPEINMSFSAPTQTRVGQTFNANILINTGTNKVETAEVVINFPSDQLRGVKIAQTADPFLPVALSPGSVDNTTGQARIKLATPLDQPNQGNGVIGQVQFQVVGTGTAEITLSSETEVITTETSTPATVMAIPHRITITDN